MKIKVLSVLALTLLFATQGLLADDPSLFEKSSGTEQAALEQVPVEETALEQIVTDSDEIDLPAQGASSRMSAHMGEPECSNDPPDMTVYAATEHQCLGAAQAYCGYRIASVCFDAGAQSCSFSCIGGN